MHKLQGPVSSGFRDDTVTPAKKDEIADPPLSKEKGAMHPFRRSLEEAYLNSITLAGEKRVPDPMALTGTVFPCVFSASSCPVFPDYPAFFAP